MSEMYKNCTVEDMLSVDGGVGVAMLTEEGEEV